MPKIPVFEEYAGYHCLARLNSQTSDLYLVSCGSQKCPSGYSWGPAARPEYHLHFVLDGEGYLEVNKKRVHLKRGQLFLCPPNITVHYYADLDSPWYYSWVSFDGTKAASYLKYAGFDNEHLIRSSNIPPEEFTSCIHEMLQANQLTTANEFMRIGHLYHLMSLLITSNEVPVDNQSGHYAYSSETYIEHALQYISANYNSDIHISDIADYIGINRSYLYSIFRNKLQQSPQEYLTSFRMTKATQLLSLTTADVKDIAGQVGYKDYMTFSKAFKRTLGISPTKYRETHPSA